MRTIEETDERFTVGDSTIPGAGNGLFAVELIPKGEYLEIIGVQVDVAGISHLSTKYADRYKFAAEPSKQFQHAIIPIGYAAFVNQSPTPDQQNVAIAHLPKDRITRNPDAGQAVYMAVRDIQPGEEILGNYNRSSGESGDEMKRWRHLLSQNFYGLRKLLGQN